METILIGAGVVTALISFAAGIYVGGDFVRQRILHEIVGQGFLNLGGVRYRVDPIGRQKKGP